MVNSIPLPQQQGVTSCQNIIYVLQLKATTSCGSIAPSAWDYLLTPHSFRCHSNRVNFNKTHHFRLTPQTHCMPPSAPRAGGESLCALVSPLLYTVRMPSHQRLMPPEVLAFHSSHVTSIPQHNTAHLTCACASVCDNESWLNGWHWPHSCSQ